MASFNSPIRLSPLIIALASAGMFTPGLGHAQEDKATADLKAAIDRAQQELARLQRELAAKNATPAQTPASTPADSPAPEAAEKAQTRSLGEVVVRRRVPLEKVQDIPVATSVISGADLSRELSQSLEAITKRAAGVTFNQSNTRGASLSIRGLGKRGFAELQDPSVLLTQDGVSYGLTQLGNFDFYDVDTVEVRRGPQGTSGGKGASAGEVIINSKPPSFTPTADFQLTYGQREALLAQSALGGTVIDGLLAWRGSFAVNRTRGFYTNSYNERGNYSLYNKDRLSGRTQLLFTPSDTLRALVSVDFEPRTPQLENGLTEFVDRPLRFADGSLTDPNGTSPKSILLGYTNPAGIFTGPRAFFNGRGVDYNNTYLYTTTRAGTVNFNENQGQFVSNQGASVKVDWDIADHRLTSITAYRAYSFDARNDEGTPLDISKNGGGGVFYRQYSQELKFASKAGGWVDYVGGLYLLGTRDQVEGKTGWGSDAGAWFATSLQYNVLERNSGANRGAGLALLRESLVDAFRITDTNVKTKSNALFGQADFHLTEAATLTAGLRLTKEDRSTEDVANWANNGAGAALNPVATARGYQLGGFNSVAFTAATNTARTAGNLAATNSAAQLSLADSVANRYFGATITATPGQAYNSLTPEQRAQVAAAKALRAGAIGPLITGVKSDYKDTLYTAVLSPSYKFNDRVTGYVSWQYGEKAGSAITVNGLPQQVKPERTNAFELGAKSSLFNKSLIFNADVFLMDIKDYQQTVRAIDDFATATNRANGDATIAYASVQGNVPKVQAKGIEVDALYSGLPNTVIRVAGSYNDARYKKFPNAALPVELGYLNNSGVAFIDQSGKRLAGAPRLTFNIGAEYSLPFGADKVFHTSFNTAYTTGYNNDELLSVYSWVPKHALVDLSVGAGTAKRTFDVNVVVKNAFDNRSHEVGWTSYEPYPYPRWVGIVISGSL